MPDPYGVGTYQPMSQPQQPQNPYTNAYNYLGGGSPGGGSGPARTMNLGTEASPQEFAQRDQGFMEGLQKNFEDKSKWGMTGNTFGSGYSSKQMDPYYMGHLTSYEADTGMIPIDGTKKTTTEYNTLIPTANIPDSFKNFADAQRYFQDYFNMTQGYQKNALSGLSDWMRGTSHGWTPVNERMIGGVGDIVKQREQMAMQKYLDLYNQYGAAGEFGSGFQKRTTPWSLG